MRRAFFIATLFTAVLCAAPAAVAGDNWLIGSWNATTEDGGAVVYVFADDNVTLKTASGDLGPIPVTYALNGDTIACTSPVMGDFVVTRTDATHATGVNKNGRKLALVRQ